MNAGQRTMVMFPIALFVSPSPSPPSSLFSLLSRVNVPVAHPFRQEKKNNKNVAQLLVTAVRRAEKKIKSNLNLKSNDPMMSMSCHVRSRASCCLTLCYSRLIAPPHWERC
ncbi:hypothetical protein BCR41DRAFT_390935 [Lobosporangium transversale]|uniref:Uncharacterized protein n=1 Tax=Lobosporangium transversale TaxID=64571 RepID=A0A1Y2G4Z8_9FUNG|nr:hypothetical protein BCR41DRAFT_390935 [Lobosporangium transversale]ORY93683.1 hypothetical protein BCR41DRAFT_390935 [Lobosporangium transversale]|eukprot:XP_021875178.1 hypothetical protein BCR41DRAFT_390935 [Lobosporangium transversale]